MVLEIQRNNLGSGEPRLYREITLVLEIQRNNLGSGEPMLYREITLVLEIQRNNLSSGEPTLHIGSKLGEGKPGSIPLVVKLGFHEPKSLSFQYSILRT